MLCVNLQVHFLLRISDPTLKCIDVFFFFHNAKKIPLDICLAADINFHHTFIIMCSGNKIVCEKTTVVRLINLILI